MIIKSIQKCESCCYIYFVCSVILGMEVLYDGHKGIQVLGKYSKPKLKTETEILNTETNILRTESKILKLVNGSSVRCCKKSNKLLFQVTLCENLDNIKRF